MRPCHWVSSLLKYGGGGARAVQAGDNQSFLQNWIQQIRIRAADTHDNSDKNTFITCLEYLNMSFLLLISDCLICPICVCSSPQPASQRACMQTSSSRALELFFWFFWWSFSRVLYVLESNKRRQTFCCYLHASASLCSLTLRLCFSNFEDYDFIILLFTVLFLRCACWFVPCVFLIWFDDLLMRFPIATANNMHKFMRKIFFHLLWIDTILFS